MSTVPLFRTTACSRDRYKGKHTSRKAVPRFWLQFFELLETNHWEGLILWHQFQCKWKKGELWYVYSLQSGSMLWIPTWWLQGGRNTLWVCLLSEILAVNPAAEFNFHNAKEIFKAKDLKKLYTRRAYLGGVINKADIISLALFHFIQQILCLWKKTKLLFLPWRWSLIIMVFFIYLCEGGIQTQWQKSSLYLY